MDKLPHLNKAKGKPVLLRNHHTVKNFFIFLSSAGMSLTKLSLGGNYDVIYELFLPRDSLVRESKSFFYGAQ